MKTSPELEKKLKSLSDNGTIIERTENNPYLRISYKGAGNLICIDDAGYGLGGP